MKNKEIILNILATKGKVTSAEIMKEVNVSRQYVNHVLSDLIVEKEAFKIGGTRNAFYVSKEYLAHNSDILPKTIKRLYPNKNLEEHKVLIELEDKFPQLQTLRENIRSIFTFAFSEMFNNAIEHSRSATIRVEIGLRDGLLTFAIEDTGIGVFRNIMKKRKLMSEVEAIQDLLKGKATTMPQSHSGEGIFFTSRSADTFVLSSFGYELTVQNGVPSIKDTATMKRGTRVVFRIAELSERHLGDIFKKYTDLSGESDFGFDKTEVRVKLYTIGGVYISRSQARRILSGLDKFKVVILDFEGVPVLGQAFTDEIYRVFQNRHPNIKIIEENMTEGVRFMIERAKQEAKVGR